MTSLLRHETADVIQWCEEYAGERYHALLSDFPYSLISISKRFKNGAPAKDQDGAYTRQSAGFMGAEWDGFESLKAYQEWCERVGRGLLKVVHPGALGIIAASPRTVHRLACGMEDAGWEILDRIHVWGYGTGFPHGRTIWKDFRLRRGFNPDLRALQNSAMGGGDQIKKRAHYLKMERRFKGRTTLLKPAYEPLLLVRAPGKLIDAAEKHGTGTIPVPKGARFAANLMLMHDEGCTDVCTPNCAVRGIDAQSGVSKSTIQRVSDTQPANAPIKPGVVYGGYKRAVYEKKANSDEGGASRLFWVGKSPTWEREAGLDSFPVVRWSDGREAESDRPQLRASSQRRNPHPTLKPILLTQMLAGLLLPPQLDEPRRILIPFAGVLSEAIGAHFAGWDEITAIERESNYVAVGRARWDWWTKFQDYESAEQAYGVAPVDPRQLAMF